MEFKRTNAIKTEKIPSDTHDTQASLPPQKKDDYVMSEMMVGTYVENKGKIYTITNKYEVECDEEMEEHKKACIERLNKLNVSKSQETFNTQFAMSSFKWEERNMIELLLPKKGGNSIYIFNPFINQIEQIIIENDDFEDFPIGISFFIRLPYCYCSGGKIINENGEYEDTNQFYTLRRKGVQSFEKIELPTMLEAKSNHCIFEIPYFKSICVLGGVDSNDVEIYKLEKKKWSNLPQLNEAREGATCCVINDTFVYCFFGYNNTNSEYCTTVEKLDLDENVEWQLLNPFGNKSFMKKKFSACIKYRENFEEKIFILGGINVLNSESMDCLVYNEINNTIEKMKSNLPYKSSFNCNSFTLLPNGLYSNLTSDFQVIQYQPLGQIFFGLRKK